MKANCIGGLVIALIGLPAFVSPVMAECDTGGCPDSDCCVCEVNDGTGNFIEIGVVGGDVTDSELSYEQLGLYPDGWLTSGRVLIPTMDRVRSERFELRWDDISSENGRAWGRLAVWPATLSFDGYVLGNHAWNSYSGLALQEQESTYDRIKLRFHRGELDNMSVTYEGREFNREGAAPLSDYSYDRLTYVYNFNLGCDSVRGSFRQVATAIDAPRTGTTSGEIDSSILKLDARLNDDLSFYGKGVYTSFNYDNLPDDTFESTDYRMGLRLRPDCNWELSADYRTKDYPVDNTVSSHVDSYDSYGTEVTWLPGCGNRIQAGYEHRNIDYTQLRMQDPAARGMLRGAAVLTPQDVAPYTSSLSPEQDEVWTSVHWSVTNRLSTDTRVSFTDGDVPGTDLVGVGSTSLFYDLKLTRSSYWYYDVNGNDQLAFLYSGSEMQHDDRDSDFGMRYMEGSWSRCTGGASYLTLAVSNTDTELDAFGVLNEYTSDDTTYLAGFSDSRCNFDYGLDLSMTDGSGTEEYQQLAVGADLELTQLGPVGIRLDWFSRDYDDYPAFDTEAFEVGLNYSIHF